VSFSVWCVWYQRKVGDQFFPELFFLSSSHFHLEVFHVYITLHVSLVVVFLAGSLLAGLSVFNTITVDAGVIRLHY
jgi:hypothetical protein